MNGTTSVPKSILCFVSGLRTSTSCLDLLRPIQIVSFSPLKTNNSAQLRTHSLRQISRRGKEVWPKNVGVAQRGVGKNFTGSWMPQLRKTYSFLESILR